MNAAGAGGATSAPGGSREAPGEPPGEPSGEWVSVAEAARRLGITPRAVRHRIRHRSLVARPKGNSGREVLLAAGEPPAGGSRGDARGAAPGGSGEAPGADVAPATLLERAVRAEAERDLLRELAGRELAAKDELVASLREALARADQLQAEHRAAIAELRAELLETRRPWLVRVLGGLRRR